MTSRGPYSVAASPETPTANAGPVRGGASDLEPLGHPAQAQLARRAHVAEQRRGCHHRGARQVALAAHAHSVRPVAVERGDGALAGGEGVRALAEARPAPRGADLRADRFENARDGFAVEPRVGALAVRPDA